MSGHTGKLLDKVSDAEIKLVTLQTLMDQVKLDGSILIYDQNKRTFYSNDFKWAKQGKLPASTFKIPNSIIALETGVVSYDKTVFKWTGEPRRFSSWEQDLSLLDAFHYSCVPCYQDVARNIGENTMNGYINKFDYGNMVIDRDNIDSFWLTGDSRISQFEQIDFLKRLYSGELPISKHTQSLIKKLLLIEQIKDVSISGKTGWSIANGINNAWFVGYVESDSNVIFFATNVEPQLGFDMGQFSALRKEITYDALKSIKILQ